MAGRDRFHLLDSIIHNVVEANMSIVESFNSFQVLPLQTLVTT